MLPWVLVSFFYMPMYSICQAHLHYSDMRLWHHFLLFWVVVCPHFWSMYGFHCIPPFSKSFIYVNTSILKIHGFNSKESAYCQSSIMRYTCVQNSLLSFLSASFSSLQALLTTQLLSHIWKEQKDFRGKILSPWPLEDFAIGGTWFNDTQNFAVTIDYLETDNF